MDANMEIILSGCCGKMGNSIICATKNFKDCKIVGGIDRTPKACGFPVFETPEEINIKCDVIIDFSHPNNILPLLDYCKKKTIPCVIGTTGFDDSQISKINEFSQYFPIFMSSNMSLAVYVLNELAKIVTKKLGKDFDVEIVEKHHRKKIDAPSGTALTLANSISQTFNNVHNMKMNLTYDRHLLQKDRAKNEIGIHSIRGGSINGEHEIIFAGDGEVLTISHQAESREIFANGAIKAAKFLHKLKGKRSNGMYSMQDLTKDHS